MSTECECDMRTRLVGDGCRVCNPALALEYADETIEDLRAVNAELLEALENLERTAGIASSHADPYRVNARAAIRKAKGEA